MEALPMRPLALAPEMITFLGGLAALVGGSFLPRTRQWVARAVVVAALSAAGATAAVMVAGEVQTGFEGSFAVDVLSGVARLLVVLGTLAVVLLGTDELAGEPRESETYALLMFVATGTMVLAGSNDLLVLAAGFLLASIPLYGLVGLARTRQAAEAALKTYLIGALFGITMLLGITVLFGLAGGTGYPELAQRLAVTPRGAVAAAGLAVIAGLAFKAGSVPAHYWVPDAAQGAWGVVAAFVTTVPKIGAVAAAYRLVLVLPDSVAWTALLAALAVASMTLGNLAAYWQDDPRRLLGWSTVSQIGYLLVPVAVAGRSDLALPSMLVYLAAYTTTNISAFAVSTALPRRRSLADHRGLVGEHPWLAMSLVVSLLGLVGTPPTGVFIGKLTTASAAWDAGQAWLAIVVLLNSVFSLFYYLRWIAPALRAVEQPQVDHDRVLVGAAEPASHREAGESAPQTATDEGAGGDSAQVREVRPWSHAVAVVTAALSVVVGLAAGPLWALADGPLTR